MISLDKSKFVISELKQTWGKPVLSFEEIKYPGKAKPIFPQNLTHPKH